MLDMLLLLLTNTEHCKGRIIYMQNQGRLLKADENINLDLSSSNLGLLASYSFAFSTNLARDFFRMSGNAKRLHLT